MEIFNGLNRIYNLAELLKPLAKNVVSPDIEAFLISVAAQLLHENPAFTNDELLNIAPEYIEHVQKQSMIIPEEMTGDSLDAEVYFEIKGKPVRYREEYYLDDESEEI